MSLSEVFPLCPARALEDAPPAAAGRALRGGGAARSWTSRKPHLWNGFSGIREDVGSDRGRPARLISIAGHFRAASGRFFRREYLIAGRGRRAAIAPLRASCRTRLD